MACRDEGAGLCLIQAQSTDVARRLSSISQVAYSIDWTGDPIQSITGWTAPGGQMIPEGSWTNYNAPAVEVTGSVSDAPLTAYSWDLGASPDCIADSPGDLPLTLQLPILPEGPQTFQVRALDEAGNCGPPDTFTFRIDTQGDAIDSLLAFAAGGSEQIFENVWHPHTNVDMNWTAESSDSPVAGYSWSTGAPPDCTQDVVDPMTSLSGLPQGITEFRVRALDEAGNCGPVGAFSLAVDSQEETLTGLEAFTEPGGSIIQPAAWHADNDPYMTWDVPPSTSPVLGYSWSIDAVPACAVLLAIPEVQLPTLADGMHTISVRAIDESGNCGPVTSFPLWIDSLGGIGPGRIPGDLVITPDAGDDLHLSMGLELRRGGRLHRPRGSPGNLVQSFPEGMHHLRGAVHHHHAGHREPILPRRADVADRGRKLRKPLERCGPTGVAVALPAPRPTGRMSLMAYSVSVSARWYSRRCWLTLVSLVPRGPRRPEHDDAVHPRRRPWIASRLPAVDGPPSRPGWPAWRASSSPFPTRTRPSTSSCGPAVHMQAVATR
jgi:hypothetical protein